MSLVKSPALTAKKLAAHRANGRRSAGPRTRAGKDRIGLNPAWRDGRYSQAFRSNLLKAREDVTLLDWIYARVCESFQPVGKGQWQDPNGWRGGLGVACGGKLPVPLGWVGRTTSGRPIRWRPGPGA